MTNFDEQIVEAVEDAITKEFNQLLDDTVEEAVRRFEVELRSRLCKYALTTDKLFSVDTREDVIIITCKRKPDANRHT